MQTEKWPVLNSTNVIDHPFLRVDRQEVQLPDGRIIPDWHRVHARDYINVVVVNEQNEALILEGYKHGLGRSSWQVVGGYIEAGEEPLATAQRELLEETGLVCEKWQSLGSFVVDANRFVGVGHFFLAQQPKQIADPDHDDLEAFQLRWLPVAELGKAVVDGRVGIISYAANIALALLVL